MDIPQKLDDVAAKLRAGEKLTFTSPRELLGWFGHYRRTWRQVRKVNAALQECGLFTFPDFEGAGFDDPIAIRLESCRQGEEDAPDMNGQTTTSTAAAPSIGATPAVAETGVRMPADPVHRVGRFLPTPRLVSVTRDQPVEVAITEMLIHDFSQLPVMQGDRNVAGMISWRSIGQTRALGSAPQAVRECMELHYEVKADDSIFDAIRVIQEHDCVLVRNAENRIVGILTAADISGSFEQLSRPFLLLSYIENHLRALIRPKFTVEDLQSAKDPADTERQISDVSDMTFGEYMRLLENETNWQKLGVALERRLFIAQLSEVREIRNDVMHFNPEGIEDTDMETLKKVNRFLLSIVSAVSRN